MTVKDATSGLLRNALLVGSGSTVALIAVFVEAVIAVRILSTAEYGTFVLATVVVMFLTAMADLGITAAVTQRVARASAEERSGYVTAALGFRLAVILGIAAVTATVPGVVDRAVGGGLSNTTLLIVLMFAVTSIEEVLIAALRGFELHPVVARLQVLRAVSRLLLSTVLLLGGVGTESLVISWIAAFSLSWLGALISLPRVAVGFDRAKLVDLLQFGRRAVFPRLITYVVTFVPVAIIGYLGTKEAAAIFAVAQRLPAGLRTLSDALTTVFFPRMTMLLSAGERADARNLLQTFVLISVSLLGAAAVVAGFVGGDVLRIVFGESYGQAGLAFTLLLVALAVTMPNWLMGYALSAAGRPAVPALITVGEALVLLPVEVALIGRLQHDAAPLAMVVAALAGLPVAMVLLARADLAIAWRSYLGQVALLAGCVGVGLALSSGEPGPLAVAGGLVVVTGAYLGGSFRISYRGSLSPLRELASTGSR